MSSPLIKICGITREEDVEAVVAAGADYVGLNFYPPSPRCLGYEQAGELARLARRLAKKRSIGVVAVMVNLESDEIHRMMSHVEPDILQFHGDESLAFCTAFQIPCIKAIRIGDAVDLEQLQAYPPDSIWGRLIDAKAQSAPGGTGLRVPLELARQATRTKRTFLAGGLTPDNVRHAIENCSPFGVDVASGVESQPGVKCPQLIRAFINAVHALPHQSDE